MSVILPIAGCWFAWGALSAVVIEIAARHSNTDGPLSQSSFVASTSYTLALIVGGPVLAIFALAASMQTLWRGRIPLTNKVWWPARARRQRQKDRPGREERFPETAILIEMIEVRKRYDERLRSDNLSNWPMFRFWTSPEATVFDAVSDFCWLLDAGLTEDLVVERLRTLDPADKECVQVATLRPYIEEQLRRVDPAYLDLRSDILTKSIDLATQWARDEIDWINSAEPYPPCEWLGNPIQFADAAPQFSSIRSSLPEALGKREWRHLRARIADGDELRTFCSPPDTWERLAGRKGVALVRRGKPIVHIVTVMN